MGIRSAIATSGFERSDLRSGFWGFGVLGLWGFGSELPTRALLRRHRTNHELLPASRRERNSRVGLGGCEQCFDVGSREHGCRLDADEARLLSRAEKNLRWIG